MHLRFLVWWPGCVSVLLFTFQCCHCLSLARRQEKGLTRGSQKETRERADTWIRRGKVHDKPGLWAMASSSQKWAIMPRASPAVGAGSWANHVVGTTRLCTPKTAGGARLPTGNVPKAWQSNVGLTHKAWKKRSDENKWQPYSHERGFECTVMQRSDENSQGCPRVGRVRP